MKATSPPITGRLALSVTELAVLFRISRGAARTLIAIGQVDTDDTGRVTALSVEAYLTRNAVAPVRAA